MDEGAITIASEAASNAMNMIGLDPLKIGAIAVRSQSKPYSVGTITRHGASFPGIGSGVRVGDLEGAYNA